MDTLYDGTFYLVQIDEKFRRSYARKGQTEGDKNALKRLNNVGGHLAASKLDEKVAKAISADFHKKTVQER